MNNQVFKYANNGEFPFRYIQTRRGNSESLKNLNHGFSTSGISVATRRKIAKHCKVLGIASGEKKVRNSKGEYILHNSTFITLTLPADQIHDDATITKTILGKFLDKARKLHLLRNYVWRAEKQKNGNIHYHILTDTFANFSLFRRLWYLACRELGYMQRYFDHFHDMTFDEYRAQAFNAKKTPTQIAAAYERGRRSKWQEPPSIQVDFLQNISSTAKYVSKYISKGDPDNPNIVTGRTWGASQSVSEATKQFTTDADLNEFWYNSGAFMMNRKVIEKDFFSICLFSFNSLIAWFGDLKEHLSKIFRDIFQPCQFYRNSLGLYS